MNVSWTALASITPDRSFSAKTVNCPIGTLDSARAFQQSKCDWEPVYLLQMSRGGTCWGGQGFREQHLILWLPISARRKRSVKAGSRTSLSFSLSSEAQRRKAPSSSFLQAQHHLSQAVKWVVTSLWPLWMASPPATLPAGAEEIERTQKPPLSETQLPRRQAGHFHVFLISSNKYLLIAYYLAGTSGLQNKRHSPHPQEALGSVMETGVNVRVHQQVGHATTKTHGIAGRSTEMGWGGGRERSREGILGGSDLN